MKTPARNRAKQEGLRSHERAFRAAALADLLADYCRDGNIEEAGVDQDVIGIAIDMLHELLGQPGEWEGIKTHEEQDRAAREGLLLAKEG